MGRFTKQGILIEEYNLSSQDFFEYNKNGQVLTIVRRPGIEKIAKRLGIVFFGLQINAIQLANEPVFIAVINAKKRIDEDDSEMSIKMWSDPVNTSASAAPSNCIHDRFIEIVENRVKHRAILQLADLHELHVHSVDSSAEFGIEERKMFSKKRNEKEPEPKAEGTEGKKQEIDTIINDLQAKRRRKRNNDDLLK